MRSGAYVAKIDWRIERKLNQSDATEINRNSCCPSDLDAATFRRMMRPTAIMPMIVNGMMIQFAASHVSWKLTKLFAEVINNIPQRPTANKLTLS